MNLISRNILINVLYVFAIASGIAFVIIAFLSTGRSLVQTSPLSFNGFYSNFLESYSLFSSYYFLLTTSSFILLIIVFFFRQKKRQ